MIAAFLLATAVAAPPAQPSPATPCQKPLLSLAASAEASPAPVACNDGSSIRLWRMSALEVAPPPTIGQSCTAYFRALRDVQAKTPDDQPLPKGHLVTCFKGKVTAYRDAPLEEAGPMPNLYSQPTRCGPVADEITRRIQTATEGRRPAAQYAVIREVDGCAVPTPVGYHQDYLLPGKADPFSTKARPAGEPPRRR